VTGCRPTPLAGWVGGSSSSSSSSPQTVDLGVSGATCRVPSVFPVVSTVSYPFLSSFTSKSVAGSFAVPSRLVQSHVSSVPVQFLSISLLQFSSTVANSVLVRFQSFHFLSSVHYPISFSLSLSSLRYLVAVKRGFDLSVRRSILNLTGCAMQSSSRPTEPSCSLFKPVSTSQFACWRTLTELVHQMCLTGFACFCVTCCGVGPRGRAPRRDLTSDAQVYADQYGNLFDFHRCDDPLAPVARNTKAVFLFHRCFDLFYCSTLFYPFMKLSTWVMR